MRGSFLALIGIVMLMVALLVILASVGVLVVCGWHAFATDAFYADGQCAASDTPSEVFGSFAVLGAGGGLFIGGIWGAYRFILRFLGRTKS